MKKRIIVASLLFIGFLSCRKTQDKTTTGTVSPALSLADVKNWFSDQASAGSLQLNDTDHDFDLSKLVISWEKASSFRNSRGNFWLAALPGQTVFQNSRQGYRKIAFLRDSSGGITARILEIIPDVIYYQRKQKAETKDFTGRLFIYDQYYRLLSGKLYSGGKVIGKIRPASSSNPANLSTQAIVVTQDCQWYDENYVDADGVFTVYSQQICNYDISDDGSPETTDPDLGGGDFLSDGAGGGAPVPPPVSNLPGENQPGINPRDFMKCFGNIPDAGATMKVTIYVQQPWAGTSFNSGPNSVGHVAIGLTKSGGGTTITQTVGYYPDASGIAKMHAPSKIEDNSGLDYNVSITYNVSAAQFASITNFISNPPATYDLTNYNCTNFVYDSCLAGSIMPPAPYSIVGMNGAGGLQTAMTPAGMGYSIQNMQGQSGVNTNGGLASSSKGPCN